MNSITKKALAPSFWGGVVIGGVARACALPRNGKWLINSLLLYRLTDNGLISERARAPDYEIWLPRDGVCVSRLIVGRTTPTGVGGGPAAVKHKQLCLSKSSSGVITRTTNGTFAVTDDGTIALPGKQSDYG